MRNNDKDIRASRKFMEVLENITQVWSIEKIKARHKAAGAPMHYIDENTPPGFITCLMPNGTIKHEKCIKRKHAS